MIWNRSEFKSSPEKCEGRVRIRMPFAWLPVRIGGVILWLERYVLFEEWSFMQSDSYGCYGNYGWYPIKKLFRHEADAVRSIIDHFEIKEGVQISATNKKVGSSEYAKVYNYLYLGKGPLSTRHGAPEIRWYKVGKKGSEPLYLSKLMGISQE